MNFADEYKEIGAIIEVKLPKDMLDKIADFTHVDPFIFKCGTVTIHLG